MNREQTAEWVGYYFGLQRAVNLKRLPEEFVQFLLSEMKDVEEKLPAGTIDKWPAIHIIGEKMTQDSETSNDRN